MNEQKTEVAIAAQAKPHQPTIGELVAALMYRSNYSQIAQVFILSALSAFANSEAAKAPEDITDDQVLAEIGAAAWVGCAREMKANIDAWVAKSIESGNAL